MPETREEIHSKVENELANSSQFKASQLQVLTGGTANFIFCATLEEALSDGTSEVVVKHGEPFVALNPSFAISDSRCKIEVDALRQLSKLAPTVTPAFSVGTPKVFHFNPETKTQIQESFHDSVSLKQYALEHYKSPTPDSAKAECVQLGVSLGKWLRSFHEWSIQPEQQEIRDTLQSNKSMQQLKHFINYQQLVQIAEQQPDILGEAKEVFEQVRDANAESVKDEKSLVPIHGDFWTGNVLLPNQPIQQGSQTRVGIIDWELTQLGLRPYDSGQMVAELWQLSLYKQIEAGVWIIQGFSEGYGNVDEDFTFRTLIQVGIHLVCFGSKVPGWGSEEQQRDILRIGRDTIVKAWEQDRSAFQGHPLESLFS